MFSKTSPLWLAIGVLAAAFVTSVDAHAYSNCQTTSNDPLKGCPKGTILVSPTHKAAKFTNIQSAILSLDATTPATILILNGIYTEQLNVTRTGPLTLLGEIGKAGTNLVTVQFAAANVNVSFPDNAYTSVLTVAPTLEASLTGSGPTGYPVPAGTPFGNTDFRTYNIDFRNIGQTKSTGPALAVSVSYANAGFYFSGFYSYQDTVSSAHQVSDQTLTEN
jgi:pectinesterase